MQLDKTHIAIRERSWLEICDLSLHVIRRHAKPLLIAMLVGVVPMIIVNALLIDWMLRVEEFDGNHGARYVWTMFQLVFVEAPLAMVAVTVYLGEVMFHGQPSARNIARMLWQLAGRLFVCQGIYRGTFVAWLLAGVMVFSTPSAGDYILPLVCVGVLGLRAFRPFLNEIILLERNPFSAGRGRKDSGTLTIARRSKALHEPNSGNLLAQHLGATAFAVMLALAIGMTLWFLQANLSGDWGWSTILYRLLIPTTLWLTAGYFAVVRFLCYIDLRIRQEGWAVELRLRAEATRLTQQVAS